MGAETEDRTRGLTGEFAAALAQVTESMTGQRAELRWDPHVERLPEDGGETLWWAQVLSLFPLPAIWVGTPRPVWEELGGRTLRAAGLEPVDPADARSTWMEMLGQALAALARAAGTLLGQEVTCVQGCDGVPPAEAGAWSLIQYAETDLPPIRLALSGALAERLRSPAPAPGEPVPPPAAPETGAFPAHGRTLDLLLDVELPISISFGRTQIPLKDVLKLTTGSIVELNRGVSEPVEVLVNHSLIARGEVVVIEGNYGVRIQQIASTEDRLRSLR